MNELLTYFFLSFQTDIESPEVEDYDEIPSPAGLEGDTEGASTNLYDTEQYDVQEHNDIQVNYLCVFSLCQPLLKQINKQTSPSPYFVFIS